MTTLRIYVQPRAGRTEVVGWHGGEIKIRVKAPPVDGAANEELLRFLADTLRVPRGAVRVKAGATSRHKTVSIEGADSATVTERLLGS